MLIGNYIRVNNALDEHTVSLYTNIGSEEKWNHVVILGL